MPKDFKENFGQRSTSVQSGWPVIHKNKVFTKSTTKTMAMTTIRTTTECFFASNAPCFIDWQGMTWRPTQFVSVYLPNCDRHFYTFLGSTEYIPTFEASPFPVNIVRETTTDKKVWSISSLDEDKVHEHSGCAGEYFGQGLPVSSQADL